MIIEIVNTKMTRGTYRILSSDCIQHRKIGIFQSGDILMKKKMTQVAKGDSVFVLEYIGIKLHRE